jgi:2'-5' RNA ligase
MRTEKAVVIYPGNISEINKIQKKYDGRLMKPHVTLVYPFYGVDEVELRNHIERVIKGVKPFQLELKGIGKSKKEFYLYLLCKKGKNEIMKIYRGLHKSLLKEFKNEDMPKYTPHVTLGKFENLEEINKVVDKLESEKLRFVSKINAIYLLTFEIKNHKAKLVNTEKINLSG